MRSLFMALSFAPLATGPALHAQVDLTARAGLTWATPLLRDDIIEEVEVRQKLAPTLVLGASLPIAPRYDAGLELTLASSGYRASEAETTTDLGTIRTGSVTLGLHGPVATGLKWRAGAGLVGYFPKEEIGIFQSGGTTRFLAGAGIDYRRPMSSSWQLIASLRYDFHRFTTDELQSRRFSQSQGVQRISATVGLAGGSR
jgi:preprotein translocase subunit Sec61beta